MGNQHLLGCKLKSSGPVDYCKGLLIAPQASSLSLCNPFPTARVIMRHTLDCASFSTLKKEFIEYLLGITLSPLYIYICSRNQKSSPFSSCFGICILNSFVEGMEEMGHLVM